MIHKNIHSVSLADWKLDVLTNKEPRVSFILLVIKFEDIDVGHPVGLETSSIGQSPELQTLSSQKVNLHQWLVLMTNDDMSRNIDSGELLCQGGTNLSGGFLSLNNEIVVHSCMVWELLKSQYVMMLKVFLPQVGHFCFDLSVAL